MPGRILRNRTEEGKNMTETQPRGTQQPEASVPVYDRARRPFWTRRSQVEDVFDDFMRTGWSGWAPHAGRSTWPSAHPPAAVPTLDVIDKEKEVKLIADLPGLTEEDIDVEVSDSTLTISGEKKEESEKCDTEGERYVSERSFGAFARRIPLPEGIDKEKIDASFKNGVLTVHLPKKPEA